MNIDNPAHSPRGAAITRVVLESFRLNARLLAVGERLTREFGTSAARWTVLSELELAAQPRTVPQIARALGLKRQGIQRLVDALAASGLTHYQTNPDHARAMLVELTGDGRALLARLNRRQAQWANRIGEGLDLAVLDRTLKGLLALSAQITAEDGSAAGRRRTRRAA